MAGLIGVVTGLRREARRVERAIGRSGKAAVAVLCLGPGPGRAAAAAHRLLAEGASALVSFGIAGGLQPGLFAGAVVVAREVVDPRGRRYRSDAAWHSRLIGALIGDDAVLDGAISGSAAPVADPAAKAALHRATGACAVDLESHAVAAVAAEAHVPFLAVRAIADPATRGVPEEALRGLAADGGVRLAPPLVAALARPQRLAPLLALALDARRARATLRRVLAAAGPGLRGPGIGEEP